MEATRARRHGLAALAVLLALAIPAIARAEVDATVEVPDRQRQAGKVIRVVAVVEAHEALTVDGRGRVRIGGKARALTAKATPRELSPDEGFALKLRPGRRIARRIATALNAGQRPRATITVLLANQAGAVDSTRYRVRLTR